MKPTPANPLYAHVGFWLRFVSNHVSHAFKLKVESHGVTVAEWVVLRALFDVDEVNPSEIAGTLGMTRGAISKLVDRLVAKNLVKCSVEKGDRRFQSLVLKPTGRRLVPILAALADRNDEEFFGHLDQSQRAQLIATLRDLVERRKLKSIPVS